MGAIQHFPIALYAYQYGCKYFIETGTGSGIIKINRLGLLDKDNQEQTTVICGKFLKLRVAYRTFFPDKKSSN